MPIHDRKCMYMNLYNQKNINDLYIYMYYNDKLARIGLYYLRFNKKKVVSACMFIKTIKFNNACFFFLSFLFFLFFIIENANLVYIYFHFIY